MPGVTVDGHDLFAVYEVAGEAILLAREGGGPSLIECKVNRYFGHFEGDAQRYRGADEVKKIREKRDCIANFAAKVTAHGLVDMVELDRIDRDVASLIDNAVIKAKAAPKPVAPDLCTDVYTSY